MGKRRQLRSILIAEADKENAAMATIREDEALGIPCEKGCSKDIAAFMARLVLE